jgi:two-component system cell cycle sensor histidine kinase/response regulator CckA
VDGNDDTRSARIDLRALFTEARDSVLLYDPESLRIVDVNDVALRHYGFTREEFSAMTLTDLRPAEDVDKFLRVYSEARDAATFGLGRFPGRWRHKRKDGSVFDVEILRMRVLKDDRLCGVAIARDVSDQEKLLRVEQAMRAGEERFRAMIESTNDAIALLAADGTIVYGSPSVRREGGIAVDDLVGRCAFDFIHPDDARAVKDSFDAVVAEAGVTRVAEFRTRQRDGSWLWTEGRATNLLHNPSVRAVVASYRDITERKGGEAALRESEERYRLLFDASPLPILVYDLETRAILAANETAVRLYGYARDALLARTIDDLDPPGEANATGALPSEADVPVAARHRKRDGSVIDVEVTSHSVTLGAKRARLVVVQDVTDRKRLEAQLLQSQKMEAVGLLAGGIAHDFNNLLSIILASAEMAERSRRAEPGSLHEVVSAASRAAQLTRKLLAFSRKQVLHVQTLDLGEAVEDFARLLTRVVGEDVELVMARRSERLVVRADAGQIEQVLLNLCTNARQAMPKGGKLAIEMAHVRLDAAFVAQHPWARVGSFAELRVIDSGVGMDDATRARAFEPFFTTKPEGTGLGLATVYGIVKQHQGCLDMESIPGVGTTVRVLLPLTGQSAPPLHPKSDAPLARGKETLLIAEDEAPLRAILARTLEELGYRVIEAEDGERALLEFERRAGEIDLVLLDVVMPKLGGPESYARMKAIHPATRVLFTTGYAPHSAQVNALVEREGHLVLGKPFKLQELTEKVREALARSPR